MFYFLCVVVVFCGFYFINGLQSSYVSVRDFLQLLPLYISQTTCLFVLKGRLFEFGMEGSIRELLLS